MALKSRLLTTAIALPLVVSTALTPARGFDVTGEDGDADATAPVSLTSNPSDAESIIINGTQGAEGAALIIDDDRAVEIDGAIIIRDRESADDDAATYTLNQAVGIKIDTPFTGSNLSLKSGMTINISEILGPQNNDSDEDGIIEGSSAIGTAQRIGLWVDAAITGSLIGEGGSISIDGNNARGVQIDGTLSDNFDFSTAVHNGQLGGILGDDAVGVEVNADITGYYRQRGAIDVRGEDSIGIEIATGATVSDGMMIDNHINATGYSLIVAGTTGGPQHGRDESDLDADETTANNNERRRSGAAVDIAGDLAGGLVIGGKVNRILTRAEADVLTEISEDATDDDGDRVDISGGDTRSTPVHFDGNRPQHYVAGQARDGRVSLTSYGEAANTATLKITGDVGDSANGGSIETLLDLLNDDAQSTPDIYTRGTVGLKKFYYSYGLMNRASIEADGLYDGFKADAVLLDGGATIHGGFYNSGTVSALAYNENAISIELDDVTLSDGLRNDGSVFLNEGFVRATVSTHAGADADLEEDSYTATAILLTEDASFNVAAGQTGTLVNRGFITASSGYTNADGTASDGENALALNATASTVDFNLTQEILKNDALLDTSNANSATNPYIGGGDTDIDRAGDVDDDNDPIGDGRIDDRDISLPQITGDVRFNNSDNVFAVKAGTVSGDISFGNGDDALNLSNEVLDDDADDYVAPLTTVTGRITKGTGDFDITIGDRTQLHLDGQEGDDDGEAEGLSIDTLSLSGSGDLKFTIDQAQLNDTVLNVTTLNLSDEARLTPGLEALFGVDDGVSVKLIAYDMINKNSAIGTYLADDTPFIYDVALSDDGAVISADFSIKDVADLGLNQTEAVALSAVIEHFRNNDFLEQRLTAINNQEDFQNAYSQLFPHYSDGTAQQLALLSEAATGAVSQHLQIVAAGGRRGGDGWLQQFGDYRKQDAGSDNGTVSGTSYGLAFGYDFPLGAIEAMGLYAQMNFTAVNEKTTVLNEVKSDGASFGAYIADSLGPLRYELNAAYGQRDLESTRVVNFNGYGTAGNNLVRAAWGATSTSASARVAVPLLQDRHLLRLEAGVDYFNLAHDDFSETQAVLNQGFSMQIADGESEKLSQFIGLRGMRRRGGGDPVMIVWEPNYYLGYRTVSDETPYKATANFVGTSGSTFTLENFMESEDAVDFGFGVAAHNDYFAFEFNYRGQFADGLVTQGGGVSIRLLF